MPDDLDHIEAIIGFGIAGLTQISCSRPTQRMTLAGINGGARAAITFAAPRLDLDENQMLTSLHDQIQLIPPIGTHSFPDDGISLPDKPLGGNVLTPASGIRLLWYLTSA